MYSGSRSIDTSMIDSVLRTQDYGVGTFCDHLCTLSIEVIKGICHVPLRYPQ